jgi:hypothetical protein
MFIILEPPDYRIFLASQMPSSNDIAIKEIVQECHTGEATRNSL